MDAKQINVFRGAVTLLAHSDCDIHNLSDRHLDAAIYVAHRLWGRTAEAIKGEPYEAAKQFDNAA